MDEKHEITSIHQRGYLMRTKFILSAVSLAMSFGLLSAAQAAPTNITPTDGLNPAALKSALSAYQWAVQRHDVSNKRYLTIVDFTKPSNQKRLYVIDLSTDKVVLNTYVAHGKNSGMLRTTSFSDRPGSDESMYGAFTTTAPYYGEHGKSLRVNGLEPGVNGTAMRRAVVIHSAWYMTPSFIKATGRAGRSDGCFAVSPTEIHALISDIQGGSFLYAYAAPEKNNPLA
jgi:hypothetical protein